MVNKYLIEYVSQQKKEINGSEYANLIDQIFKAKANGYVGLYEPRLLERLVQIFLKDHQELYFFSTGDQLKLLKGFDDLVQTMETPKKFQEQLRSSLISMTLKTVSSNDEDLLKLMQYYSDEGILNQNEYLLAMLRQYVDERFNFMDRKTILKYCEFLKDVGMFFEDKEMIVRLNEYFTSNYYVFELPELFSLMKLHSYCFHKPETM